MGKKLNEAAKEIGESPHVVRHWVKELRQYIPVEKGENGYNYFDDEAMDMLRMIQRFTRENGYSIRQIEHHLATGGKEIAAAAASPEYIEELRELRSMVDEQKKIMGALVQQLAERDRKYEERAEQRDRILMNTLREIQDRNRLLLEEKNSRPWWKFWGRGE